MKLLVIVGAGGHGRVVAEAAEVQGDWSTISFLDDAVPIGSEVAGFSVSGNRSRLPTLAAEKDTDVMVAIGDNEKRHRICQDVENMGGRLATVVHPGAVVSRTVEIAGGTVVCAGAVVNSGSRIGKASIINTGATVDHDCCIGSAVHVSPGAVLAGGVTVGDLAWIGAGATVIDGLQIGAGAIVGAAAAVIRDVDEYSRVVGVPARPLAR